jgi:putative hydrolase of the HAD superfamily
MRFLAVIFDMGDIFFDATPWRKALSLYLQQHGIDIDYPELCRRWEEKLAAVYVGRRPYWDAFREFMADVGLAGNEIDEAEDAAKKKASGAEKRVLFDGVAETLTQLRDRGMKLAVLSDTESREPVVRGRLAEMGIDRCFDAVVTSIDIGHVKPQPEAFAAALRRLNVQASETIFVGHDAEELEGAMRCGLTAVAFNYEAGAPANRHLAFFSELLKLQTV